MVRAISAPILSSRFSYSITFPHAQATRTHARTHTLPLAHSCAVCGSPSQSASLSLSRRLSVFWRREEWEERPQRAKSKEQEAQDIQPQHSTTTANTHTAAQQRQTAQGGGEGGGGVDANDQRTQDLISGLCLCGPTNPEFRIAPEKFLLAPLITTCPRARACGVLCVRVRRVCAVFTKEAQMTRRSGGGEKNRSRDRTTYTQTRDTNSPQMLSLSLSLSLSFVPSSFFLSFFLSL